METGMQNKTSKAKQQNRFRFEKLRTLIWLWTNFKAPTRNDGDFMLKNVFINKIITRKIIFVCFLFMHTLQIQSYE